MNNGNTTTASNVQARERQGIVAAAVAAATLTPAFLAKVEKVLAEVQYVRTACGLLGIARRTFYHWKRAGAALRDECEHDQQRGGMLRPQVHAVDGDGETAAEGRSNDHEEHRSVAEGGHQQTRCDRYEG